MADRDLTARFSASTAGFTAGTNVLKQKLTELNTNMEQTRQAVKQANSEMKEYEKELTQLRKETNNGATATDEQRNKMQLLRDNIARITAQIGIMRTTEQDLRGQIRSTNAEIESQKKGMSAIKQLNIIAELDKQRNAQQKLRDQIHDTAEELDKGTQSASTFVEVLKANLYSSAVQTALRSLTNSLKNAAQCCYNVGSSFEAGMSQVSAISGATASELERLTEKAKSLGASTKFTATQVTEAMNYMAMAGWNAEQMLSGIDGVMNLAAASGGDLAQTSDIVTDAITAFGLKAEDVGHFADVLAAASANANTNVAMMGETFSYCAPIAGALGFSIEDVSEAIGLMANSGVKSSLAGTALRTLFTKLSDDIKITGENLGEVTIQTSNADGSMRSLKDILADMRSAFSQLTQSEKSSAAESIAGKYAMTGLLTLMNAGAGDVDKLRGAIENCDGATADMADTMQNNVSGAVTIMQSALEGLGIAVYEKFGDKLKTQIGSFTNIVDDLKNRIDGGELDEVFEHLANSFGDAADGMMDFAADALPVFIEGLAKFIDLLVQGAPVITGFISGLIQFKAAIGIGNIISGVVKTIRSFKSATEAAATAQRLMNAAAAANPYVAIASAIVGVVGGLITYAATAESAGEKMTNAARNMREEAEKLNQEARSSADAAKGIEEFQKEYEELKDAEQQGKDVRADLESIQQRLNSAYETEGRQLDLVNGAYSEQLGLLQQISEEKRTLSENEVKDEYKIAKEAMQQGYAIELWGQVGFDKGNRNVQSWDVRSMFLNTGLADYKDDFWGNQWIEFGADTTYQQRYDAITQVISGLETKYGLENIDKDIYHGLVAAQSEMREAADSWSQVQEDFNSALDGTWWKKGDGSNPEPDGTPDDTDNKEPSSTSSDEKKSGTDWSDINSVKKYYKYLKDTEQINDTDYYRYLEHYGNKLLDPDSDEWRTLMAEIYQGRKSKASGSGSATTKDPNEEQYDSDKKYLKWRLDMGYITEEEYYANLADLRDKYLDESSDKWRSATLEIKKYQEQKNKEKLDTIKDQYDSAIAAVDAEMKLHEREKEDEEVDKKIADIDRQLQYDRLDDYSRSQLEKKKQELLDEKEETQWQRDHEDLKDGLETVYTMAQDAYANSSAQLQDALSVASQVFGAIGTGATQTATAMNTVNNNSVNLVMNAVAQSSEQIAQAVVRLLSSGI